MPIIDKPAPSGKNILESIMNNIGPEVPRRGMKFTDNFLFMIRNVDAM